jgi:hypothetical protein
MTENQIEQQQNARITRIGIGRMVNLGNYEHIRYDITVELQPQNKPSEVFGIVEGILSVLAKKPPHPEHEINEARRCLAVQASALSEWEIRNLGIFRKKLEEYDQWQHENRIARKQLDQLGGTAEYTDHKETWEENF